MKLSQALLAAGSAHRTVARRACPRTQEPSTIRIDRPQRRTRRRRGQNVVTVGSGSAGKKITHANISDGVDVQQYLGPVCSTRRWYVEQTGWLIAGIVLLTAPAPRPDGATALDSDGHRPKDLSHQSYSRRIVAISPLVNYARGASGLQLIWPNPLWLHVVKQTFDIGTVAEFRSRLE
jgi:hypothetical protein